MYESETRLKVRYAETDKMGVVHHSNYPIWFEAGRTEYIKGLGISYSEIEERGILLPVIELNCKYKGSARYEDDVVVRTRLKTATYTRLVFSYEVVREDTGDCITSGETMHVWTNTLLKPLNIKKNFPQLYELMSDALQQ